MALAPGVAGYLGYGNYSVAPDGQHFLMIKQEDVATNPKELNIVLNWSEELERRVPQEGSFAPHREPPAARPRPDLLDVST